MEEKNCNCMPGWRGGRPGHPMPAGQRPMYTPPGQRQTSPQMPINRELRQEVLNHAEHTVDANKLLLIISQSSFAMDDARLFLDTHPECEEAFAYYKKMEKIRKDAIKEYEIHCGSILSYQANERHSGNWNWNTGPLPWENNCCNGRKV